MKSIISILFVVITSFVFSQSIGEEFRFSKSRTFFEGVVGESNGSLLGVSVQYNKSKTNQLFINTFEYNKINLIDTKPINLPKSKKFEFEPNQMFIVSGQLYLICFKSYKKIATKVICAYEISSSGQLGTYHLLDSVTHIGSENKELYQLIDVEANDQILFFTNRLDRKKSEQYITIKAFDKNLSAVWETKKVLTGIRKKLSFYDFQYDGKDRIFMMAKNSITKGKEIIERNLKNNVHQIWCLNKNNSRFKQIELKLKDKWIFDMRIKIGADSACYIGGIYANKAEHKLNGSIAVKIDKDFKIKKHVLSPFKASTLKYINKKNDGARSIPKLTLHSVKTNKEGDFIILSEQFYKDIEQYYDPLTEAISYTDVFHYQNGVITWFDKNLNLYNETPIKKNQSSSNDGGIYSSFQPMVLNDTLCLFYNDHPKNTDLSSDDGPKPARTASIFVEPMVHKFTKNGYESSNLIDENVSISLIPKNSFQPFIHKPGYLVFEQNKRNLIIRIEAP